MQCPTDGATLAMSERSGIEIDYCPTCRGVWLDRGELDKIIERSFTQQAAAPAPAPTPRPGSDVRRGPAGLRPAGLRQEEAQGGRAGLMRAVREPRGPAHVGPVEYVEIARAESERGELVLRERPPATAARPSLELRANGVFVMDTVEVSTERALAAAALDAGRGAPRRWWSAGSGWASRCTRCSPTPASRSARSSRSSRRWSAGCATARCRTARPCSPTSGYGGGRRHRGGDGRGPPGVVRPGADGRRQRARLPGPRRQRRALRARRSSGCAARPAPRRRAGGVVGGRGPRAGADHGRACSATPRRARTGPAPGPRGGVLALRRTGTVRRHERLPRKARQHG